MRCRCSDACIKSERTRAFPVSSSSSLPPDASPAGSTRFARSPIACPSLPLSLSIATYRGPAKHGGGGGGEALQVRRPRRRRRGGVRGQGVRQAGGQTRGARHHLQGTGACYTTYLLVLPASSHPEIRSTCTALQPHQIWVPPAPSLPCDSIASKRPPV